MYNDLKIYLREDLLFEDRINQLLLEKYDPYEFQQIGRGSFKFVVKDFESEVIRYNRNGVDCEVVGTQKRDLHYTIDIGGGGSTHGIKSASIVFQETNLGYSSSAGSDATHAFRVLETVFEAAKLVAEQDNVRYFSFAGAGKANSSKSCRYGKVQKSKKEKESTQRSRVYTLFANKKARGSALMIGNSVMVDIAKVYPEKFSDENYNECAKLATTLHSEGVDFVNRVRAQCSGDKLVRYEKVFTQDDITFKLSVDDSYNVKYSRSGVDGLEEIFQNESVEGVIDKIIQLIDNPFINFDLSKFIKKIASKLTEDGFEIVDTIEGEVFKIKLKYPLDSHGSYVSLIMGDNEENKINVKLQEFEFEDGEIYEEDEEVFETTNSRKIIEGVREFIEEIGSIYSSQEYNALSTNEKIEYLNQKPNIHLEYDLINEMLGTPINQKYNNFGYVVRYTTNLPGGKILVEDFKNDTYNHYRLTVRIQDTIERARKEVYFKVYDAQNFGQMLQYRNVAKNEINNQLTESQRYIKKILKKTFKKN